MAQSSQQDETKPRARFIKEYLSVDEDAGDSDLNDDRGAIYAHGRRYHSLTPLRYLLPNDPPEQLRLNMAHHLSVLSLSGGLHVVDLPTPLNRILDVGTGTGAWAIDMAQQHPQAQVLGVDLSPIQPRFVPENCGFVVGDVEEPWAWDEKFDFIHSGNMAQGIRDWPGYIGRVFENLNPNGVVELMESRPRWKSDDWSIPVGGYIERYNAAFERARRKAGLTDIAAEFVGMLRDAGFVDVMVVMKKVPFGTWVRDEAKKELGKWALKTTEYGVKSYGLAAFTRELGMSYEDAVELCEGAYAECRMKGVHTYFELWFVVARKPGVGEVRRR